MVRFAILFIVLLSSSLVQVVKSAYLLSQVCKSDTATWASCNPLEQATIKKVLENCRHDVLAEGQVSTGGRRAQRRLGEQEHEQQQRQLAACPESLSCASHDPEKMCFADVGQFGCDRPFGGMEMAAKAQGLATALRACTKDAILSVVRPGMQGSACEAAAEEILGGCEQVAYLYM